MYNEKASQQFLEQLQELTSTFGDLVSSKDGGWRIKGFIDDRKSVYTISGDTKVVSKVLEIQLFPAFKAFGDKYGYLVELTDKQNYYPDLSLRDEAGLWYAVDLKTTYREPKGKTNIMTLGACTGYFRDRRNKKNCMRPYGDYAGHFVLGAIYSRAGAANDQLQTYSIDKLEEIGSVIGDIQFFAQPKYRIASDKLGSHNTMNIGSVEMIDDLVNGKGPFAELGVEVFDDYWMYYLTKPRARTELGLNDAPYTNLADYFRWKKRLESDPDLAKRVASLAVLEDNAPSAPETNLCLFGGDEGGDEE